MSNVDRLYNEVANWIADLRMNDPKEEIPHYSIHYGVSAPRAQPILHTFVVKIRNKIIASGHGNSIDHAARNCWGELAGLTDKKLQSQESGKG